MNDKSIIAPDHRIAYETSLRYTELRTILGRIRRRQSGDPTHRELERIETLQTEIATLRRGDLV